jgi:hypothetical protein
MKLIDTFVDINVGHALKGILAVLTSGFVLACMTLGEMVLCIILSEVLHLKYNAFASQEINELAGNAILFILPLIGSIPLAVLVWKQFYPPKKEEIKG